MNLSTKLATIIPLSLSFFLFASPVFAAAPDGLGPWADFVVSSHQGLMKNGLPVPAVRSDPTAALGVAENTPTIDSTFFSLGFGGNIVLGFDNGISTGALIVESTIKNGYPAETAKIEMSQDGINWIMAGNVSQDGTVPKPAQIECVKFVRVTDTSNAAIMPDAIADGYDVDGVSAIGNSCTIITPTPTPTQTPIPTATPTPVAQTATPTPSNNPGLPDTGGTPCTSTGVTTIPTIILARRISATSIFVSWGPFAGLHDFYVEYGYVNGTWLFNTKVSGFFTTINDLPANQSIWIHVAATDNCVVGTYGPAVLVGGTAATNTPGFPNTGNPLTPGFPNTGTPGFPNTGFEPKTNTNSWALGLGIVISLVLATLGYKAYPLVQHHGKN